MTKKTEYNRFHVALTTDISQQPQSILDRLSKLENCDLEGIDKSSFRAVHEPLDGWRIVGVQNGKNYQVICNEEKGIVDIIQ